MNTSVQRKLTTLLAADAVGYSRAMDNDEVKALTALRESRAVFKKFIERHYGRIVNTAGDGLIAEFPSVVEAVQCAIEVQQELGSATKEFLAFRIGIHLGDVMIDGDDLLGEGVNLAARLESMADPGGILISQQVYDQVQHKLSIGFDYIGERRPKNFSEDVSVYSLALGQSARPLRVKPKVFSSGNETQLDTAPNSLDRQANKVKRLAKTFGLVWAMLLVLDLATGEGFWAHWPGIVMLGSVCMIAAPLFTKGWFNVFYVRLSVIIGILALINFATWTGYPWVLWPAAPLICVGIAKRLVWG